MLCAAHHQPKYNTPNIKELLKKNVPSLSESPGEKVTFSQEQVYIIVALTILLTIYLTCLPIFVVIWFQSCTECPLNYLSNIYLLVPLLGGALGFTKLWLNDKNVRNYPAPFTFYYFALISWGIGNLIWTTYNVLGYPIPYPSIDDFAFLLCNTLCMMGMVIHVKRTAAIQPFRYANFKIRMATFGMALILLMALLRQGTQLQDDYLKQGDYVKFIKFILDVVLPLFSGIFFALLNLWRYDPSFMNLEKSLKNSIRVMRYGAFFLFLADFGFSIGTLVPGHNFPAYFNGGWQDFCYATGMLLLSVGSLFISPQLLKHSATVSELAEQL